MTDLFLKHKIPTLAVLGVLVAGGLWYGLSGGTPSDSLLSTQGPADGISGPGGDVVKTLLALRTVKLDGSIFSNPAFAGLKDFGTEIVSEPVGRPNPFAPLSVSVFPTSTPRATQLFLPAKH